MFINGEEVDEQLKPIRKVISVSMGLTFRQKDYINKLKIAEKIKSKSEFVRDAIDFYTLFFEQILKFQEQEVDPDSLKMSYVVGLQEVRK